MRRGSPLAVLLVALVAALAGMACRPSAGGGDLGEGRSEERVSAPAEGGFCKEHGVLEAICTKCNPKLIPVFQAKGDWCAEHGFPESICPTCHPEREGKPAGEVASDGAPADGTKVRFKTKDTAALAGIETAKATVRPNAGGVVVVAKLVYDATKLAHINPRSPGVVRALKVDLGSKVKEGDALAVIDSAEVGADRARLTAARSRAAVAEENFKREKGLQEEGIMSRKSLLAAQQELDAARAEVRVLAASLAVTGSGGGGVGSYTLRSPIAGVVTQRNVTIGKLVTVDEVLFEIVDTSSMWAELDVPEADAPLVAADQSATVFLDGLGERGIPGKVAYVAPSLDPHTRTAKARVGIPNPDGTLRANMFGQARIDVGAAKASVMVPRIAVQRAKDVHLVFVRIAEDEYEARRVQVGASEGGFIEVKKGIKPDELVVTTGSFLLKTETLKDSIGAGCCETD